MGGPEIIIGTNDLEKGPPPQNPHQDKMRNIPPSRYHDTVVKPKLPHRPWLQNLDQFMDPDEKDFGMSLDSRMNHFDVQVIYIPQSGKPEPVIKCPNSEDFEEAIRNDRHLTGTLILAEGISRAMIEALGTRFDLEPEFFANHLAGTELFRKGRRGSLLLRDPPRAPFLLPDYIRSSPFYTAESRRPYHIEGGDDRVFKLRTTETTTPRGIQFLNKDFPDIFATEKISVYNIRGSNIGIILSDQLLSDTPHASHIPSPVALLDHDAENLGSDGRQHQVSSRRALISWLQRLPPVHANALFEETSQLALQPILKMVESNGVMFLGHARHTMNRILTRHCDDKFPDSIPFFLQVSRTLHRCIHEQQRLLRHALRLASLRDINSLSHQTQDFGFLAGDMDGALKALEEDVRFLVGESSILVGEASIREGKIVGWVSKFAALFLPVSLLATILSISDPGYERWAILGGLSVPFVLVSVYFMFFWNPVFFNGGGRESKGRGGGGRDGWREDGEDEGVK